MIELTVKTLDSKNHSFSVPNDVTVKQFKEHIADTVNIPVESQRLIYCGRVLQDDKNLTEYDVNGKVVHLVQRAPPGTNSRPDNGPPSARSTTGTVGPRRTQQWRTLFGPGANNGNAMYLGAMAFPAEIMDASGMSMQQPRPCLSQSRMVLVRSMLRRASAILTRLENPQQENGGDTLPETGSATTESAAEEEIVPIPPISTVEITSGSFIIGNQQIDEASPRMEVQAPEPETVPSAATHAPSTSSGSEQPPQNEPQEGGSNEPPRYLRTQAMAELLEMVSEINTRLQPFMTQYQQLMRDDPVLPDSAAEASNQRLFSSVSEVMHFLAHAYHALSDILCDFSQPPPRNLRCRPVLIHHSAVVQTGIPIQVTGNMAATNAGGQQQPSTNGTTAAGASESAARPAPSATSEETVVQTSSDSQSPSANPTTQQPHSPATTPPRMPRLVSVGGGGPGPGGPGGFEFFVDVSPGSITIDSVEATVVTSGSSPNTTESNQTWQNPPEFVQNLISALAGQFMGATLQQYRFPDQQNAEANTQQTTGTQSTTATASTTPTTATASSQSTTAVTSSHSTPAETSIPSTTDAASTQQSPSNQPAPAQNSQARSSTATHPTTATQTRSTARPHVHLSPSLQGLRTVSFDPLLPCNSHHIRVNRVTRRPGQPRPAAPARATSISISLGNGDPVINIEPQPARASGTQQAAPGLLHLASAGLPLPPALQGLLQSLRGNAVFSGQNPSTITQLLQSLPGYSYTPGESIFTDIFTTLAQSLSFIDMVQLGLGSSECLVRVRPQLRQLVSHRLLNDQPLSTQSITEFINRFNIELTPYYSILSNARLREDVDVPASISQYNHTMLPTIIRTITEEDDSTFHGILMRNCALYIRQLCAILQYCCLDGVSGLESILRSFVNQATTGVPGALQDWTMSHSLLNFRTFVSSLQVPLEDFQSFLVYRVGGSASSPLPAPTPPHMSPGVEPMDVNGSEEVVLESTPSHIREPSVADIPPTQHMNEMVGWHNELPSEWVPVITRDIQRQRRHSPQRPFSDAYLSSMPSKRRKLISSAKPQGNLSQVISESMATALGAAGMSSSPEVDTVAQRAGQDSTLRSAYREQVRTTVSNNLSSNVDFIPDKYPNSAKYFKKE